MFSGLVIRGDGIGRSIGYPTANIDIPAEKTNLNDGVYAARATVFGKTYASALVIQHQVKKVEVYMLGYDGVDCYGIQMSVDPIQKVSEIEEKDGDELIKKIARDIELVKEVLNV